MPFCPRRCGWLGAVDAAQALSDPAPGRESFAELARSELLGTLRARLTSEQAQARAPR
jgi:hypothetical protein